ncbi:MAG: helix-turn-helix domain-containing protein [Thermoanaerobacteraceae bacterium]|nr:helix-turn-helix domain-containing protein [Thermoanaerobacteraceae bacterium]
MDILRIGDKVISQKKIERTLDRIFELRAAGLSQAETAKRLGLDRSFISRLEGIGEIRKGRRIAVIGFPIKNKKEIETVLNKQGVDFCLLFTEKERWDFINQNGLVIFNYVMELITRLKEYDLVVVLGSNYRIDLVSTVLGQEVVGVEIGKSPIEEDIYISPEKISRLIKSLKEEKVDEKSY